MSFNIENEKKEVIDVYLKDEKTIMIKIDATLAQKCGNIAKVVFLSIDKIGRGLIAPRLPHYFHFRTRDNLVITVRLDITLILKTKKDVCI